MAFQILETWDKVTTTNMTYLVFGHTHVHVIGSNFSKIQKFFLIRKFRGVQRIRSSANEAELRWLSPSFYQIPVLFTNKSDQIIRPKHRITVQKPEPKAKPTESVSYYLSYYNAVVSVREISVP